MRMLAPLALAGLLTGGPTVAAAFPITFAPGEYDNTLNTVVGTALKPIAVNNQTTGLFRDVIWWQASGISLTAPALGSPDYINQGQNLVSSGGSPPHATPGGQFTALNFTGPAVAGGQSYLSIYDTTPADGTATKTVFDASQPGGLRVSADVLFTPVGHASSAGVVALYDEGQDALALLASNGGGNNPDKPSLRLVFQSRGQGITLASTPLNFATFAADVWYRVTMDVLVTGDSFQVVGTFQNHSIPNNPTSALDPSLITSFTFSGSLTDPDAGPLNSLVLTNPGEVGVMAMANIGISAGCPPPPYGMSCTDSIGVSITNFDAGSPVSVSEPSTMLLAGTGLMMLGYAARRRLFCRTG